MNNNLTVTVRRGGGRTSWGDDAPATTRTVSGCTRWPRNSSESNDRSDVVTSGWTLSVPAGTDIISTDQVQMPDDPSWWDIDGDPLAYESPFSGWAPGIPVALTRTKG